MANTVRGIRTCEVCGTDYRPTYYKQRTCGRKCGAVINIRPKPVPKPARSKVTWRQCCYCGAWHTTKGKRRCGCTGANNEPHWPSRIAARERRAEQLAEQTAAWRCVTCGSTAMQHLLSPYCAPCRARVRRDDRTHRHRARKFGVEYEPVNALKVHDRDGWICHLCGDVVGRHDVWPDQMCASLDHVVPLSLGGPHAYSNVRTAHWLCNVLKGVDQDRHFRLAG